MAIVKGTDEAETLNALNGVTNGNDTILGHGGDDNILGLGGNDVIIGGAGADHINGGSGADFSSYVNSTEGVVVSLLSNQGFGGTAEGDTLTSIEKLGGSFHDDFLVGNGGDNVLQGGLGGNDVLKGGGGADTLYGDSDNDVLKGGGGADTLYGGSGIDTAVYHNSSAGVSISLITGAASGGDATGDEFDSIENVEGSAFDDWLFGSNGVNVLVGGDGDDTLKGFAANDTIEGGDGNDYIDGGTWRDDMTGGLGDDIYIVDHADDDVIEAGGQGNDTVRVSTSWMMSSGASIETLETTDANGTAAINLTGSFHGNNIIGNDGNNVINGSLGVDSMTGRGGDDTYFVYDVGNSVIEAAGQGTNSVLTSINYTLGANVENLETTNAGGASDLLLTGNALANQITGNNGDNTLNGGVGVDTMTGHAGSDSYNVDNSADVVVETASYGSDTVYSTVDYVLSANIETLSLNVGTASSAIGNAQHNVIYGNVADNFLNGGDGVDQLSGLGGNDTFVFQIGQAQGDSVYEFEGNGGAAGDSLHFSGYGTAAEGATFTQQTATDWLITSADGLISETITLVGAPSVDASDFVFV